MAGMSESLMGGGAFEVEDDPDDPAALSSHANPLAGGENTPGGAAWAYDAPETPTLGDGKVEPIIRDAFCACDIDDSGEVGSGELHAVLLALGCRLSLQEVVGIVHRVEHHVRAGADAGPKQPKPALGLFNRDFHLHIEKKQKAKGAERDGFCFKSKATVGAPIAAAHRAIEQALYRVIHTTAQGAKQIGVGAAVEAVAFEGLRCQFGKSSDVDGQGWVSIRLELDAASGVLSIVRPPTAAGSPGLTTAVSLKDCFVSKPRRHRRGYPHSFRLDTALPDAVPNKPGMIPGTTKFTLAASTAEEMDSWIEQLHPFAVDLTRSSSGRHVQSNSLVDGQLDMVEFQQLIKVELASQLPGDWRSRCRKVLKLRRAFLIADLDSGGSISKDELKIVLLSSDASVEPSPNDLEDIWKMLDREGDGEVDWFDFLRSMTMIEDHPTASRMIAGIDKPNRWALVSLLIDVPCCKIREQELLDDMSGVERKGIQFLEFYQRPIDHVELHARLKRATKGELRRKTPEQLKRIKWIRMWLQFHLLWIATITNGIAGLWENYLMWARATDSTGANNGFYLNCNDCQDEDIFGMNLLNCTLPYIKDSCDITGVPPTEDFTEVFTETVAEEFTGEDTTAVLYGGYICGCADDDPNAGIQLSANTLIFWALNVPMIGITVLAEIYFMGFAALRASCLIAAEYEFRLTPLNESRAFVARSFIRATFELGNPGSAVLGVDPAQKTGLQLKLESIALALLYTLKVLLLGLAIKLLLWQPFMPMALYTWVGSYAPLVSSILWDCLIGSVIMDQVELRAEGVTAATELFNELLDEFNTAVEGEGGADDNGPGEAHKPRLSTLGKIQVVRAIGVAIVENGTMYPPMELLLRHAIQYFDLSLLVRVESAQLDSLDRLTEELRLLPVREQKLVASVHMLAMLLDGALTRREVPFFEKLYSQPEEDGREIEFRASGPGGVGGPLGQATVTGAAAGPPDLIKRRQDLLPRMLQLSYLYRTRQFITAADLAQAMDGTSTQRELDFPIWRNFCGYGLDLIKCRLIKNDRELKSWTFERYGDETWNALTFRLV